MPSCSEGKGILVFGQTQSASGAKTQEGSDPIKACGDSAFGAEERKSTTQKKRGAHSIRGRVVDESRGRKIGVGRRELEKGVEKSILQGSTRGGRHGGGTHRTAQRMSR